MIEILSMLNESSSSSISTAGEEEEQKERFDFTGDRIVE